jgi:hypothetical protein
MFTMPKMPDGASLPAKYDEFKDALECCMMAVSDDTGVPDQLGFTFIPGKSIQMFSTDGSALCRAIIDGSKSTFDQACVPARFCEQFLRLGMAKRFLIDKKQGYALAAFEGGTMLYGKLIDIERPLNFMELFKQFASESLPKLYDVPKGLNWILDRAVIITDVSSEQTSTQVSVIKNGTGKKMKFHSESQSRGVVQDELDKMIDKQPPVELRIRAKRIKGALEKYTQMYLTDRAVILGKKDRTHVIAALNK